jgi:uncharacterized protein (DUF169 family)
MTEAQQNRERSSVSYREIQEGFERILKLETPPVAVKFVKPGEERPKGVSSNIKPVSFCQAMTVARQGGYAVYLTRKTLSCSNARMAFGMGTPEEIAKDRQEQIGIFDWYAPDREAWEKVVDTKFAISPGSVVGIAVAPLGKARFVPDCLLFTVNPWQAYHLMNGYLYMSGDAHLTFTMANNSLVCGYSAGIAGWEGKINLATACAGGRAYAGTEATQMYFSLPWKHAEVTLEGVKQRDKKTAYPGLITIPMGVPKSEKHFFRGS